MSILGSKFYLSDYAVSVMEVLSQYSAVQGNAPFLKAHFLKFLSFVFTFLHVLYNYIYKLWKKKFHWLGLDLIYKYCTRVSATYYESTSHTQVFPPGDMTRLPIHI